jgi:hypothetical protein
MFRAGFDTDSLADAAVVSEKSVERWLYRDMTPYPVPGTG